MATRKISADPTKRQKTRYRGVSYRIRKDGSRTYSVYQRGRYVLVEGGEHEARTLQADLVRKAARGEQTIVPSKVMFAVVAEEWFESKHRLRPWTRKAYRAALDNVLLPRFGSMKLTAITPDHVARLIRDLERKGLSSSTIDNYVLPLSGTLAFAVRRGMISVNPCTLLTRDERPRAKERKVDHVWSDEEMTALVEAAEHLAARPEARYDYTPLLRVALATGLRLWRATRLAVARR